MSKIIDISARLTNERPKLKLTEDKVYEIDDRKNTILLMNQKMQDADVEDITFIDEMITILLGKDAAKEIDELDLSVSVYQTIMVAIMAAISGEDFETAESRFRE